MFKYSDSCLSLATFKCYFISIGVWMTRLRFFKHAQILGNSFPLAETLVFPSFPDESLNPANHQNHRLSAVHVSSSGFPSPCLEMPPTIHLPEPKGMKGELTIPSSSGLCKHFIHFDVTYCSAMLIKYHLPWCRLCLAKQYHLRHFRP
jgi:hypothetical protein